MPRRLWSTTVRFGRIISDYDLHLFGEACCSACEQLGAHPRRSAAWRACTSRVDAGQDVSVISDFSRGWPRTRCAGWSMSDLGAVRSRPRRRRALQVRDPHDIGLLHKGAGGLRSAAAVGFDRAAPRATPGRSTWMASRGDSGASLRVRCRSTVHLASWRRVPGRRSLADVCELAEQLVPYVKEHGFTHLERCRCWNIPTADRGAIRSRASSPTSRHGHPRLRTHHCAAAPHRRAARLGARPFPKDARPPRFDSTASEHEDPRQGDSWTGAR
jgi:hypothetical protein